MSQKERDLFMNPYALAPIDSRVGVSNSGECIMYFVILLESHWTRFNDSKLQVRMLKA